MSDDDPSSGSSASPAPSISRSGLSLLDGAVGSLPYIGPDLEESRRTAGDPQAPLERRLEAYEDLLDSEVGDTSMSRARHLERESGLRQLHLKFEGGNPTGTQKDRIAFAQVLDALRREFDAITVATCGNYGVAVAVAARLASLRCLVVVPTGYRTRRVEEMEGLGAEIARAGEHYEAAVEESRRLARDQEIYDANPGGANTPIQLQAYGQIAWEIYDELRDAPSAVAVPVSNGTTLAGIHRGFLSLYRRGKTSRMPRIVGGSSHGKNPIVRAYQRGLPRCEDLEPTRVRETEVNEPLVNWHSIDGDLALEAIRATRGWATDVTDKSMTQAGRVLLQQEGLGVLPAATAGLLALIQRHRQEPFPGDRYVAVLTGRR